MTHLHLVRPMPIYPQNPIQAFMESFMDSKRRHPTSQLVPPPWTEQEADEGNERIDINALAEVGYFDDERDESPDTWPLVAPDPVAESDLSWEADMTEIERWS